MGTKLVRIAPYNPRQGFVKQRHTIMKPRPMRFVEAAGWYEVDEEIAALLAEIPQEERKPGGLKAFLIADDSEHAKQLEYAIRNAARRNEAIQVGTTDEPIRAARPGTKAAATASARGQAAGGGRTRQRAAAAPKPKEEPKPKEADAEGEGDDDEGGEDDES